MPTNRKPLTDEQKAAKVAAQRVRRAKAKGYNIAPASASIEAVIDAEAAAAAPVSEFDAAVQASIDAEAAASTVVPVSKEVRDAADAAPKISAAMRVLLRSIVENDYHDGRAPVGNPVWVSCLEHGFTEQQVGGLFSAAIKAGWVGTTQDGKDSTVWITAEGVDALNAADADAAPVWNGNGATPPADAPAPILATGETTTEFLASGVNLAALPDGGSITRTEVAAIHNAAIIAACADSAKETPPAETMAITPHEARVLDQILLRGGRAFQLVYLDTLDMGKIGGTWAMLRDAIESLANENVLRIIGANSTQAVHIVADIDAASLAAIANAPAEETYKVKGYNCVAKRTATAPAAYEVGTILTHTHKGTAYECTVTDSGYDVRGTLFSSLSAAARSVTGGSVNGKTFWKHATPAAAV